MTMHTRTIRFQSQGNEHMQSTIEKRCDLANQLAASDLSHVFLTREEVATLTGTTRRTLEELADKGKGPAPYRLGYRTVRYKAADVFSWLESLASNTK